MASKRLRRAVRFDEELAVAGARIAELISAADKEQLRAASESGDDEAVAKVLGTSVDELSHLQSLLHERAERLAAEFPELRDLGSQ